MGPEEDAGPTLVGGVHGGPPQADEEHGPTSLHLLRPCPQEPCQVSLELPPVGLSRGLTRAVDEDLPLVVGRRSPVRHALGHLRQATTLRFILTFPRHLRQSDPKGEMIFS